MANEVLNGANKLLERILEEARADASKTASEAEETIAALRSEAAQEAEKAKAAFEKQRGDVVRAILERSRTNAELFARKAALDKRRSVLDRAFDLAYEKLCAFTDAERTAVCREMILTEAEGGEIVLPAEADRAIFEALLPAANADLKGKGVQPVSLSERNAPQMAHGFLLVGKGYEKDCSFEALLRDARMLEDTNVSGILFD